jgi:predicted nucleic acid-binding protein
MKLVDSDVMIDILRKYTPALEWLKTLDSEDIGIPGL